jgi:hypothetical protein
MIISGYVTVYNLQVVMIGEIPLDIGYGIPLASGLVLFVVTGAFMTWLKKVQPAKVDKIRKGRASISSSGQRIDARLMFFFTSIFIIAFTILIFFMINSGRF